MRGDEFRFVAGNALRRGALAGDVDHRRNDVLNRRRTGERTEEDEIGRDFL